MTTKFLLDKKVSSILWLWIWVSEILIWSQSRTDWLTEQVTILWYFSASVLILYAAENIMEQSEFLYFNVKYKTSLIEIDLRAYICHLNFRILLTLKYRESSSNTKHGRSTSPTYVLKYENIKCQQLPLILKMKLPIKLGSNAFLGYFIFFSFGRLWSDMDFYVLNCTYIRL